MRVNQTAMKEINEGLFFEGAIPVQLDIIDSYPKAFQLYRINHSNEMLLRASLMLDETSDIDESTEVGQALVRQEIKLNLIVDILGELISAQANLPSELDIQLTFTRHQSLQFQDTFSRHDYLLLVQLPIGFLNLALQ